MRKRIVLMLFMAMLAAVPAFAQKAELGITFGWVFSDGVSGSTVTVPGVGAFDRLDPKDAFTYSIDLGINVTPNAQVGFIYSGQPSKLTAGGTDTVEIGSMRIDTYHGYFGYNWGEADAPMRPYFLVGFGATNFGKTNFSTVNRTGTLNSVSRFSSTWGFGVKFYGNSNVGGRAGMRWTPAYIKSDAAGWWCDPYWGCYLVGSAQYANQLSLEGGLTFRF